MAEQIRQKMTKPPVDRGIEQLNVNSKIEIMIVEYENQWVMEDS